MFADDTNLIHSDESINTLFSTVNIELDKIGQRYTLFHKNTSKDDISTEIPDLNVEDENIDKNYSKKIVGISKIAKKIVYYIMSNKYYFLK